MILRDRIDKSKKLLVLCKVHNYRKWRNHLKGDYDKFSPKLNFLVTDSARLDYFRKGGDSLLGRYHWWRLHPLTLSEIAKNAKKADLDALLKFGGLPEPSFKQYKVNHQRWQMERIHRVVQEDSQDSPNTVERWVQLLEAVYYCYRVSPYGPPKMKAVKKAQKLFLWDWSEVEKKGALFENLVAGHLLKYCDIREDAFGEKTELRHFKDTVMEREIDFIVLKKGRPGASVHQVLRRAQASLRRWHDLLLRLADKLFIFTERAL